MARPTITDIRSLPDIAQVFRWNLIIASVPPGIAAAPQAIIS